ncbi:hypothetical protein Clole_0985 [Cellulosilyticum lentocellum DSM 5427]|uniref:Uncharacterized protein n=1 Tax=Cellulosilyticum lentocellum (strain ATCC 49066 / DSM 5427 / NCIMB 11756 / RHM5) TaxID=642492 RepID=F2JRA8_CELLD|nr:hypothetical protein [Cellulosilyticum lentocellum]ADZ82717.1 hypothetical protein Clole_0985 [Cellulosilyticum lentocellum DSM 5427]
MEYLRNKHGIFTNNETTGQTAEEVYAQYLNDYFDLIDGEYVPKQIDICPEPTTEEKLNELIAEYNELKSRMTNTEEVIMGIMMEI